MTDIAIVHDAILQFVQTYPEACDHVVDMPYRLCSPAAQDESNIRLWHDQNGDVIAFGVLQLPFSTLDLATRPDHQHITAEIYAWGVERLRETNRKRAGEFGYLLGSKIQDDPAVLALGFDDDDWAMLHLAMSLDRALDQPPIPNGFRLRPLSGQSEVDAYVALHREAFGTLNMTSEWRSRIISHPAYVPQLDWVAEDNDGNLAAFCIGWMSPVNSVLTGQIEPLGVHPDYHRHGLGQAILMTVLRKMQELGCQTALVDAQDLNDASTGLYQSVGFVEQSRTVQYFRLFLPDNAQG